MEISCPVYLNNTTRFLMASNRLKSIFGILLTQIPIPGGDTHILTPEEFLSNVQNFGN